MRYPSATYNTKTTLLFVCILLFASCKVEKKYIHYADLYTEQTQKIYVLPISDQSQRKETADSALLATYKQQDLAADQMFAAIPLALKSKGYTIAGHDASTQIAEIDQLNRKELITGNLGTYGTKYAIDAVLITTLYRWNESRTNPTAYIQVQLRSTHTGKTLAQTFAKINRPLDTTYKGRLVTLRAEQDLADTLHTPIEGGIRCHMLQQAMLAILQDLPYHPASFYYMKDQYLPANDEYMKITISNDGYLEIKKCQMEEYESWEYRQ